jgi:hypothetical protein
MKWRLTLCGDDDGSEECEKSIVQLHDDGVEVTSGDEML